LRDFSSYRQIISDLWRKIAESQRVMSSYATISYGLLALNGLFPLLILLGLFENRKTGTYQFRRGRFLAVAGCLFIVNLLSLFPAVDFIKQSVEEPAHVAEKSVQDIKTTQNYVMNNLSMMFPETLAPETAGCWQSAISNYIEDQWNQAFRENIDKDNQRPTVDKQEDYYEFLRQVINPHHLLAKDFEVISRFMGSIWLSADGLYHSMHVLRREPDKNGQIPAINEQMTTNYRQYFVNCGALKSEVWVDPNTDLLRSLPQVCIGRCP
jgi:hypothetical protein